MEIIWLARLLLSHLLADFILQPKKWIGDRKTKHFFSGFLYLHTLIAAALAWLFTGWKYWPVALAVFVTHTIIDGWKSYQKEKARYFVIDQFLHCLVILLCWVIAFYDYSAVKNYWQQFNSDTTVWTQITAFVFLTWPSGFLIGELTRKWRQNLDNSDALENAGKWIGIIERTMILIFVLQNQYESIGLLIAAKSIIRFSEKGRTEQKTEYLLIGTLISIGLAVVTGIIILKLGA